MYLCIYVLYIVYMYICIYLLLDNVSYYYVTSDSRCPQCLQIGYAQPTVFANRFTSSSRKWHENYAWQKFWAFQNFLCPMARSPEQFTSNLRIGTQHCVTGRGQNSWECQGPFHTSGFLLRQQMPSRRAADVAPRFGYSRLLPQALSTMIML